MNSDFSIQNLDLEGLKLITPFCREDKRGYFVKNFEKDIYKGWNLNTDIYEEFESYSIKGVIRGMHFQTKNPQVKMVRVLKGIIRDVVVDLRKESATFGQYEEVMLSEENHAVLWIPAGFAHGFEVLSEDAIMSYKCIGKFLPEFDTGICWNDKELAIDWKTKKPIVSEKDASLMTFQEYKKNFL